MSHSLRTAHRYDEFTVLDAAHGESYLGIGWGTVAEFERAPGTWEIEWLILLRFSAPLEEEESERPC
jgi:hypothetical protein